MGVRWGVGWRDSSDAGVKGCREQLRGAHTHSHRAVHPLNKGTSTTTAATAPAASLPLTPGQHRAAPRPAPSSMAHGVHASGDDDPVLPLKVFLGQGWHARLALNAPSSGLYVPAGHGVARPLTQYAPAGHATPPGAVLRASHRAPSLHRPLQSEVARPAAPPKKPGGQSLATPSPTQYIPMGQRTLEDRAPGSIHGQIPPER